jgi:hypothetical protein
MLSSDLSRRNMLNGQLDCSTQFSSDYYGFGVRLGVYFSWLSSYFANLYLPGEVMGALDTNCIFLLSLLISLFKGTVNHQLYQVDGLMVMQLSSGFLFTSLSIWGYRTAHYDKHGTGYIKNFGGFGTHVRLALTMAISIYGAWFWSEGVQDGLQIAEDPQCRDIKTWFFHGFRISGGIHILYVVMTVGCSIYFGVMCLASALALITKLFSGGKRNLQFETGFHHDEYASLTSTALELT